MPSASHKNASSTTPCRSYEMKSSANVTTKHESDEDNDPPPNPSGSRAARLNHHDSTILARQLQKRYRDEEREYEFEMREKEERRMKERAEAQRAHEATMWWLKRATALVALYAALSVFWLRVWPLLGGGEEERS